MGVISESHSEPVRPQIPVEKSLRVTAYPNPAAAGSFNREASLRSPGTFEKLMIGNPSIEDTP